MGEKKLERVGYIAHYYPKIEVAVIKLAGSLSVGDKILVKGVNTSFEQIIESMQIEHENIEKAIAGQSIGLKIKQRVREDDVVYKKS